MRFRSINWLYIGRDVVTVLLVTYGVGIAGTLNGLVTPRLEIITLVLMAAVGTWWLFRGAGQPRRWPVLVPPLLAMGGALLLSAAFSLDPRRSLTQIGYWAALTLAYWVAADVAASEAGRARLERALFATLTAITLIGLYQVWAWWRSSGYPTGVAPPRPTSVLGNPNPFGTVLLMAGVLALWWLIRASGWPGRIASGVWLALFGVTLILSGARSAWVGAAVSAVTFLGLVIASERDRLLQRGLKAWLPWIIMLVFLVAVLIVAAPLIRSQFFHSTHGSLAKRVQLWRTGWLAFTERPVVGWGPMTFGSRLMQEISVPPETVHAHPHNVILYVAAETGIVGVITLGWVLVAAGRTIWRVWQEGDREQRWRAIIAGTLGAGLFSVGMFDMTFLPGVSILALWMWSVLSPTPAQAAVPRWQVTLRRGVAALLVVMSIGIWGMQIPGELAAVDGVYAAYLEDWQAAARHFGRASQRDPAMVIYAFQAAYAKGQAGIAGDDAALEEAISAYRAALAREPAYALNWANLAVLEAHAGQQAQAVAHARRAAVLAPGQRTISTLPDALQGNPPDNPSGKVRKGRGFGAEYGWYLFHVPALEMDVLPLPDIGE
jgi:O-antigen ligase